MSGRAVRVLLRPPLASLAVGLDLDVDRAGDRLIGLRRGVLVEVELSYGVPSARGQQ
jgi:hypothetical protein